jgi:hypothetical protein
VQNKAILKWTTDKEKDLSHYEVEKSDDGTNFTRAGRVPARNNGLAYDYDFTDRAGLIAPVYYRLKIFGKDGLFRYSSIIQLTNKNGFAVNNLANPFQNSIGLEYTAPNEGPVHLRLFDNYGKLLKELHLKGKKGANSGRIVDLQNLPAGFYTVTIVFENVSISKRAIKLSSQQ